MTLALALDLGGRTSFLAGEPVRLTVSLANEGSAPVRVPDPEVPGNPEPRYRLEGPGPDEALEVAFAIGGVRSGPVLRTLAPGEAARGKVPLRELASLRPGRYRLRATLAWEGERASSNELSFAVEPLDLAEASVGVGANPAGSVELFVPALHRAGEGGRALVHGFFAPPPHAGDPPERRGFGVVATLGGGAREPIVPDASFLRVASFFNWVAWREAGELRALTPGLARPLALALEDSATLLRPAVLAPGHELEVFAVRGRELALALFHDPDASREPARWAWAAELPRAPQAGAVALARDPADARRHVALASGTDAGVEVLHATVEAARGPEGFDACGAEGFRVLGGRPLGARVEPGGVRVALAVARREDARRGAVVEVFFPDEAASAGEPAEAEVREVAFELPDAATEALVVFAPASIARARWTCLVAHGAGAVARVASSGEVVPERPGGLPLALVALSPAVYRLGVSAAGVGFEALGES